MARKPREEVEGGIYHVYARGNNRERVFLDDQDRRTYLFLLCRVIEQQEWHCLSYCLMDNHVHLLIETPKPNLARGMQRLHSAYAQVFNERHGRVGHVFQGRYGAVRIETDDQLWTTVAYIAANPVRSGLCEGAEQWRWSSHRDIVRREKHGFVDVQRLLWHLGGYTPNPIREYESLVLAAAGGSDPLSEEGSRGLTPIGKAR